MLVEDDGQVMPAAGNLQVSDISHPTLIRMTGRNIELSIGQLAEEALHRGPVAIPPPCACLQPGGFHETCNTLSGAAAAPLLQGSVNAGDRKGVGEGKRVAGSVDLVGRRYI